MSFLTRLWHQAFSSKPWSIEDRSSGKLVITDWNAPFAAKLREELKEEIATSGAKTLTDEDVVRMWVDRYNYERETPHLEVVHGEIGADGKISVKLEWNDAFIRMLQQSGIEGASEDDMIRKYLAWVTSKADREIAEAEEHADAPELDYDQAIQGSSKVPTEADIDAILNQMEPEILKMFSKNIRRRSAKQSRK